MTIALVLARKGREVVSVDHADTVEATIALLADRRIGALPVLKDGVVVGIFSERDLLYGIRKHGQGFLTQRVADAMTAPAVTVTPDAAVLTALSTMTRRRLRHLPVIENDALVGFVSIGDLVKFRMDGMEADAEALKEYIRSA